MVWIYIIGGVLVLLVGFCILSVRGSKRGIRDAIKNITGEDIERFVEECVVVFRKEFGVALSLEDLEGGVSSLDVHIKKVESAFKRDNFVWYFVLPVGAFWGELMIEHLDAEWQRKAEGGLSVLIHRGDDVQRIDPFEMVMQQAYASQGAAFSDFFECAAENEVMCGEQRGEVDTLEADIVSASSEQSDDAEAAKAALDKQLARGANWFYWIAGLSVVNSIAALAGVGGVFVIGLGITQVIDAIVLEFGEDAGMKAKVIAFAFDLMIAAVVVLFGYLAKRRLRWAFVVGMILYALDGLLFVLVMDVFGLAFHAFALIGIYGGLKACGRLKGSRKKEAGLAGMIVPTEGVSLAESPVRKAHSKEVIWPVVILILTFVYVIFYALLSIRDLSNYWRIGGCLLLAGGTVGMLLRRKGAVMLMLGGALVVIGYTVYMFISAKVSMPEEAPPGALIVFSVILLAIVLWPLFLIFWFLRAAVREYVASEWT